VGGFRTAKSTKDTKRQGRNWKASLGQSSLSRLHEAQILTYLKLSGRRLGFLMNFNAPLFKDGLRRLVL
jgi:hypothetical protein